MRFIVTGCAGFIGSHLTRYLLNRGHNVVGIDNMSTGKKQNMEDFRGNPEFYFSDRDVRDIGLFAAREKIDCIFHQAAMGSVPKSMEKPAQFFENNCNGFMEVLEYARIWKIPKVVYASSSSVYGNNCAPIKTEGQEGWPLSPYAMTKRVNEFQAKTYSEAYGINTIGLRYFNVYGPDQRSDSSYAAVIPRWLAKMANNSPVPVYGDALDFSRDFTSVHDVVRANWLAFDTANPRAFGDVYNVGTGRTTTLKDLASMLRRAVFSTSDFKQLPARKGDVKYSRAAVSSATRDLGFVAQVQLNEGLEEMAKGYQPTWAREAKDEKAMSYSEAER